MLLQTSRDSHAPKQSAAVARGGQQGPWPSGEPAMHFSASHLVGHVLPPLCHPVLDSIGIDRGWRTTSRAQRMCRAMAHHFRHCVRVFQRCSTGSHL